MQHPCILILRKSPLSYPLTNRPSVGPNYRDALVKRVIAILFLTLYVYNIAGYYAVFKALQCEVRADIKRQVKETVPEDELFLIAVPLGAENMLQWLKEHEFRYQGSLYDVVRHHTSNDTTYYHCVNDTQEEQLFENLEAHVRAQTNSGGLPQKAADVFKNIAKDYFPQRSVVELHLPSGTIVTGAAEILFASFTPDVLTPPPRSS